MKPEIKKLGTLYFDDEAISPWVIYKNGSRISIRDTVPGKELEWVDTGSILVVTRNTCEHIRWKELDRQGLTFGRIIFVDSKPYLCRSLKVGEQDHIPNEWDDLLNRYGIDNDLWHWHSGYFWGQEKAVESTKNYYAVRGKLSASYWRAVNSLDVGISWRPVLERLPDIPNLTGESAGSRFVVYGPDQAPISGKLVEADDYDIILAFHSKIPSKYSWAKRNKDMVVIRRADVAWMGLQEKTI